MFPTNERAGWSWTRRPRALLWLGAGLAGLGAALYGGSSDVAVTPIVVPASATSASVDYFERRLAKRPGSFTTAIALADRYLRRFRESAGRSDLDRAEELARSVSTAVPWHAGASARLAMIQLTRHQFAAAESTAHIAATLDPRSGNPILFDVLFERGEYSEAERVLSELRPGSLDHSIRFARLEEARGSLESAELAMERACRTLAGTGVSGEPLAWCHTELAHIALAADEAGRARRLLERALAAYPGYRGAVERLAWIAYKAGELERARALYTRLTPVYGEAEAHLHIAAIARRHGEEARAERHERAFEAAATEPGAGELYTRPLALYLADRPGGAEQAVELAIREARRRPTLESYDVLGWTLYRAGRIEEALEAASVSLSWGRPSAEALYHAGVIYLAAARSEGWHHLQAAAARRHELDPADAAKVIRLLDLLAFRSDRG